MAASNPEGYRSTEPLRADPAAPFLIVLNVGSKSLDVHAERQIIIDELTRAAREHDAEVAGDALRTPTSFVGHSRPQLDQIGIPQARLAERGQLAAITLKPVGTLVISGTLAAK